MAPYSNPQIFACRFCRFCQCLPEGIRPGLKIGDFSLLGTYRNYRNGFRSFCRYPHGRNGRFFEAEVEKLENWSEDVKLSLEREIKELDRDIKEARRAAKTGITLEEKLAGQKRLKALEAERSQKRRSLFDAQDQVDKQRESLIQQIEGKLTQGTTNNLVFRLRWRLC